MNDDTTSMPSELRARLRDETAEEQADLEAVWDLLGVQEMPSVRSPDMEAAWDELVEHHPELAPVADDGRTSRGDREPVRSRRRRPARSPDRGRSRRWAWGLALVVLLLTAGALWWRQPVTVSAAVAQQRTVTLPDGSTVELNSGTTLSYRRGFQAWPYVDAVRRTVRLEGEAFFEVASGERPFAVETAQAWVEVTGTRFNVRARTGGEAETEVTLTEGRVRVVPRQLPQKNVLLSEPGQTSRVTDPGAPPTEPQSAAVDHVLAWRNDGFAVRDRSLSAVVRELERRYGVSVALHTSVDSNVALSLYYPDSTAIKTVLEDICMAHDLQYRATSQGYELFSGADGS